MLSSSPSSNISPILLSKPLPRRLRTRTLRHTPLIPPPRPQPLLRPQLQLPIQLGTRFLPMYEIAEPAPHAPFPAVEPTARLSEIGDGRKFAVDGPRGVPATVERVAGLLRRIFVLEARVDVADEICMYVARAAPSQLHSSFRSSS